MCVWCVCMCVCVCVGVCDVCVWVCVCVIRYDYYKIWLNKLIIIKYMYSNNNLHVFKPVASIMITWLKIHLIRLDQALIVLRQCRQKHDWRHMFKTVDPLSSLWPLTSDIHHSTGEEYSIVCASIGEGRGLCSRAAITENLINSYMYTISNE